MRRTSFLALSVVVGLAAPSAVAAQEPEGAGVVEVVTTEAEYRAAVTSLSSATEPATIVLDADITLTGATDPRYTGTQVLSLVGNGHTLSGGDSRRVIEAVGTPPQLNIRDIVVRDGFATSGGAVEWDGDVVVSDASFLDNRAQAASGALAGAIHGQNVTVSESFFTGNEAEAATVNANGGAIYARGTLTVLDSIFRDNHALAPVGAGSGGAVFAIGAVTIDDAVFIDNAVTASNVATGGGVRSSTGVTTTDSVFMRNNATGAAAATGGALYATGEITVADSTLTGNITSSSGGTSRGSAVYANTVELTDVTVAGNVAEGTATLAAVSGGDVEATHTTIVGNAGDPANLQANDDTILEATALGSPIGGANCLVSNTTASASVDDDGTCGLTGGGNVSDADDLRLGALRFNGGLTVGPVGDQFQVLTVFPLAGSPVIDLEPASCADPLDQRQLSRPFGGSCDAGSVEAVFEPHAFTDVDPWVEDAVRWLNSDVNEPQLMVGLTPTQFGHDRPILRSQVVRLLHRLMGEPDPLAYPPHPFTDVPAWVEGAVRWAYGEGIVTGETPTLFRPDDPITRGQVVRMVYRVAGSQDVSGIDPHPFSDVPGWVEEAVRWAANPDNPLPLVTGETPTQFNAEEDITRGQVARMVWRLAITPAAWADPGAAPDTVPFIAPPVA